MTHTSKFTRQTHRPILLLLLLLAVLGNSVAFAQTVIRQRDVPFVIKRPGSYVLGSNLVVNNPNVNAILVDADNVTIDLAGFAIIGPSVGPTGQGSGINTTVRNNVTVRNGTVRGFFDPAAACVHLDGHLNNRVENLRVQDCPAVGVYVSPGGMVIGSQVSNCGGGIHADAGSLVLNNTLFGNAQALRLNWDGIAIIGNNFRENRIAIDAPTNGHRIEGNTLTNNNVGIDLSLGSGNFFARNFLKGNTTPIVGAEDDIDGGTIDPALTNVIVP
jgi:hypothetical protein